MPTLRILGRGTTRFVAAAAAVAAVVAVAVYGNRALSGPGDRLMLPVEGRDHVLIAVGPVEETRIVETRVGNRVGSFTHSGEATTYWVPLPSVVTADVFTARVIPPLPLREGRSSDGVTKVYPSWRPEGPVELPPPQPASGSSRATAAVDETDTYGLRLLGVPVHTAPASASPVVATVYHGEVFPALCWVVGDRVTNGFDHEDFDDDFTYESTVWFLIELPTGQQGFIPDARFSRTGHGDRLGLASCP